MKRKIMISAACFLVVFGSNALLKTSSIDLRNKGYYKAFTGTAEAATEDSSWEEIYNEAKKDFTDKFEKFKKEGLSAEEVKDLTDKLLEAAGDRIEGTGTETLLMTMNKQAENTVWIMEKKETLEELIDFVGDVYAMSLSDTPPDPVDAYKALSKGVNLAVKLVGKIPVMKIVAVPMLKAYAQAIKNGEHHIEAIAKATNFKNKVIKLGWMPLDYDDLAWLTEKNRENQGEEEKPTEEELEYEKWKKLEQARKKLCAKYCSKQYKAYDDGFREQYRAWEKADKAKKALDKSQKLAKKARSRYNGFVSGYKKYHKKYRKALETYKKNSGPIKKKIIIAEKKCKKGDKKACTRLKEYRKILRPHEEKFERWSIKLKKEFKKIAAKQSKYLKARVKAIQAEEKFHLLFEGYEGKRSRFLELKAAYEKCYKECKPSRFTDNGNGTITDNVTSQIWQKGDDGARYWSGASAYCGGLTLAGNTDWRLPHLEELYGMAAALRSDPTNYNDNFGNSEEWEYWVLIPGKETLPTVVVFPQGWGYSWSGEEVNKHVRCVRTTED